MPFIYFTYIENSGKMHKKPLAMVASVTGMGLESSGLGCVGDFFLIVHVCTI